MQWAQPQPKPSLSLDHAAVARARCAQRCSQRRGQDDRCVCVLGWCMACGDGGHLRRPHFPHAPVQALGSFAWAAAQAALQPRQGAAASQHVEEAEEGKVGAEGEPGVGEELHGPLLRQHHEPDPLVHGGVAVHEDPDGDGSHNDHPGCESPVAQDDTLPGPADREDGGHSQVLQHGHQEHLHKWGETRGAVEDAEADVRAK